MVGLILTPLYSYFSTRMILGQLEMGPVETKVLTSVNGVSLAVLLVIFLWIGSRSIRASESA